MRVHRRTAVAPFLTPTRRRTRNNLTDSFSRLEVQRRATRRMPGHSSRPQPPAPYLRLRTCQPLEAQHSPSSLIPTRWSCISCGPGSGVAHPAGHGLLVIRRLRAAGCWCCASFGPRFGAASPTGHGLVLRRFRATLWFCISRELPFAFNDWGLATWRAAVWECCISRGLLGSCTSGGYRGGPAYRRSLCCLAHRESHGLVRNIGRSTEALTAKGGAVPAEARGATARGCY